MITLNVQHLTKIYGTKASGVSAKALNGINLEIHDGEFVSLMGPSESGKTTLLNILAGLDRPTTRQCMLRNLDISKLSSDELAIF